MKIALLTDGIMPYILGGMQKHSAFLAKYLTLNGCKVSLFHCVNNGCEIPSSKDVNEVLFNGTNELHKIVGLEFPELKKIPGHYIRESFRYSEEIYEEIRSEINDYDFIYVKGFSGWKLLQEKKNNLKTPPIGINFHGMNMFLPVKGVKSRLSQFLFRNPVGFNMKYSDFVFSYGGFVTNTIEKTGINNNKIIELPTGIEEEWLKEDAVKSVSDPIRFIFIGRYDLVKGIKELNQAILEMKDYSFHFSFIGPFQEKNKIIANNVSYEGTVNENSIIKKHLSCSDVLVLPSYSEGMPNVILEAMASGLAILATNVGAVSLMVNNENGLLLNHVSSSSIKMGLIKFIEMNDVDLMHMKDKSRILVERNFLWSNIINNLVTELTEKVLKQ